MGAGGLASERSARWQAGGTGARQAGRGSARGARGALRHGRGGGGGGGGGGHDTGTRARPVRPGWASLASWVLVPPVWFFTWFFDSVVFLSHCLDPVHEHCSSQNFSNFFYLKKKKINKIK